MKYDIHLRYGTMITVESKRSLDEIADFLTGAANAFSGRIWGVLADGDEPTALISIADVVVIVPHADPAPASPARVRDRDGDIWEEMKPGQWAMLNVSSTESLAEVEENYGPVEVLTSHRPSA